jgi:hypothetical protein
MWIRRCIGWLFERPRRGFRLSQSFLFGRAKLLLSRRQLDYRDRTGARWSRGGVPDEPGVCAAGGILRLGGSLALPRGCVGLHQPDFG